MIRNHINSILAVLLIGLLTKVHAQERKKITPADYDKWGELTSERLSADGKWISFVVDYPVGNDTLFLQNVATGKRRAYVYGDQAYFSEDSRWLVFKTGDSTSVIGLSSATNDQLANVVRYEFNPKAGVLAVLSKERLYLYDGRGDRNSVEGVKDFTFGVDGSLAVSGNSKIILYDRALKRPTTLVSEPGSHYNKLVWDRSARRLAFFKTSDSGTSTLGMYDTANGKLKYLDHEKWDAVELLPERTRNMHFAPDGNRVFFYAKTTAVPVPTDDSMVQVWDAAAAITYSEQKDQDGVPFIARIAMWDLKEGRIQKIATDSLPMLKLLPGRDYMLAYNPYLLREEYLGNPLADFYLLNLKNGSKSLIWKGHHTATSMIRPSPDGVNIAHGTEQGWSVYNCKTGEDVPIFKKSVVKAKLMEQQALGGVSPGWTTDGSYIILLVDDDVWLVSPDGKEKVKVNEELAPHIKLRPAISLHKVREKTINEELTLPYFNLSEGIFFQGMLADKTTALYRYTKKKGLVQIYKGAGKVAIQGSSSDATQLIIKEESAAVPPNITVLDTKHGKSAFCYQSNPHVAQYIQPRAELLSYKDQNGKTINGVLHFPAGYQKDKKYPMVVYIYEELSQNLHSYNNPSNYDGIGFALANYTNEGYFVLLPDITYILGNPGSSTAHCVLEAVRQSLNSASIDEKRMGLIGHSYGGHEVSLLITNTPIFAAAVAGAGVTNLISSYLRLNESGRNLRFYKIENQQYRMKSTPFENREGYLRNSPVMKAGDIQTPLLSWAGKEDDTVDWTQSVELHLALKRLKKKNKLLVYPHEGHILMNFDARFDLGTRVKEWFDSHLK